MKTKAFAFLIIAVLASSCDDEQPQPQPDSIYYHIVDPEITITTVDHYVYQNGDSIAMPIDTNATLSIDIDNDGIDDFSFNAFAFDYYEFGSGGGLVYCHGTNMAVLNAGDSIVNENPDFMSAAVPLDMPIGDNSVLTTGVGIQGVGQNITFGFPSGTSYYGFKLTRNGSTHFGWIMIEHTECFATIKSWAYNLTPDNDIYAGQTE
jgi:hypothetical protein